MITVYNITFIYPSAIVGIFKNNYTHEISLFIHNESKQPMFYSPVLLSRSDENLRKQAEIFISVINQLDAQNFCFTISLFHASTCLEHYVLIIRRSKLHYTASGIITPIDVMIPEAV